MGMAHYFDDVLHRSINGGTPHSSGMPRVRRSSTARSIGARSDFDTNGVDDEDARSTAASVFPDDPERARQKTEADSHMHHYISEQLNRYRVDNSGGNYDEEDLETRG